MKKLAAIALVLFIGGVSIGCTKKGYEVKRNIGEYNVEIMIDKNPPIVGDNHMTIAVKDASGQYVSDVILKVDYSMPAMPGMPAMNYSTNATLAGNTYKGIMNLSMAGAWDIAVKITRAGKTETVKFNVDVS